MDVISRTVHLITFRYYQCDVIGTNESSGSLLNFLLLLTLIFIFRSPNLFTLQKTQQSTFVFSFETHFDIHFHRIKYCILPVNEKKLVKRRTFDCFEATLILYSGHLQVQRG